MTHEYFLWLSVFAYALHIFEETILDWKGFTESVSGLKNLKWADFFVANAAVLMMGICGAMIGWQLPFFALLLPSLQIINGLFFHLIPTILLRRFSPGVISSCLFFFPIGILCYWGANRDYFLHNSTILLSFFCAGMLSVTPLLFFKLQLILKSKR